MPPILADNFSRPQEHLGEPVQHTIRRIWSREWERRSRKRSTGRGAAEEEKGDEELKNTYRQQVLRAKHLLTSALVV